jgi:hypothetical protein
MRPFACIITLRGTAHQTLLLLLLLLFSSNVSYMYVYTPRHMLQLHPDRYPEHASPLSMPVPQ